MRSQFGQDKWVLKNVRGPSYFVDIGASDGKRISNTFALEKAGWSGICVEPGNAYKRLKKNRKCHLCNLCVLDQTGLEVDFCEAIKPGPIWSGIPAFFCDGHNRKGPITKKKTISLNGLLERFDAPKHIGYLSVDTENSEWKILEGFDFSYTFQCITIEHNFVGENRRKIKALLNRHGYKRVRRAFVEDWYLREAMML
jgi:hypothetical protein